MASKTEIKTMAVPPPPADQTSDAIGTKFGLCEADFSSMGYQKILKNNTDYRYI